MCVGSLAGVTYLRYTVPTRSKKGETAVHCCDPALSVLVMLVSRNVFHVVSALQSIVTVQERTGRNIILRFSRGKEIRRDSGLRLHLSASTRWKICNYVYTRDFFVQTQKTRQSITVGNQFWQLAFYILVHFQGVPFLSLVLL